MHSPAHWVPPRAASGYTLILDIWTLVWVDDCGWLVSTQEVPCVQPTTWHVDKWPDRGWQGGGGRWMPLAANFPQWPNKTGDGRRCHSGVRDDVALWLMSRSSVYCNGQFMVLCEWGFSSPFIMWLSQSKWLSSLAMCCNNTRCSYLNVGANLSLLI